MELHSKVAMKGLGRGMKRLQHNIVDLFPGTPSNLDRWSLHDEWTYTHTHTNVANDHLLSGKKCEITEQNAGESCRVREFWEAANRSVLQKSWSWKFRHIHSGAESFVKCLQLNQKKIPAQVLTREYCEFFKNTYFEEDLWMATSEC